MLSQDEMKRPVVVQVLDSIGKNRGGLTRAVFERFRLLSKDRRAILVTVANQNDVNLVFDDLKNEGIIPAHTELINFYADLRATDRRTLPRVSMPHEHWEKGVPYLGAKEPTQHGTMIRYFKDGSFIGLVYRDGNNKLRHVDKHFENSPWTREYRDFCIDGAICLREYYDDDNKPRFRVYIDSSERPYLSAWVTPDGYEYRTVEHLANASLHHGDTRSANAAWLQRKLSGIGKATVYTDEPRTTFALAINDPNVKHVTAIHTTHYKNNRDNLDGIKHWAKFYDQFRNNISQVIFFTETQRRDFIEDLNFSEQNTELIPHTAPLVEASSIPMPTRDRNLFVTVSRLADDKRIDHSIRAFAKVLPNFPDARYEIWGSGPAKARLQSLIDEMGLNENVSLKGHTAEPLMQFSRAAASILTSKYEGFGLVITESFACGTPVIAYDVIYGPRDVISPSNGTLVPDGNIEALASAMTESLAGSWHAKSSGARESASQYSRERWATGWLSTL